MVAEHLKRFQFATRGRRGNNPPLLETENDWWALGQQHGLASPLLDWTASPFVALYFAFEESLKPTSGFRSVWALGAVHDICEKVSNAHKKGAPPILEYIEPLQDDNTRLVNQAGLFSRVPLGNTVDNWVGTNCTGDKSARLLHIKIPDKERLDCLRTLNKMNINHVTLFPDLYGAGEFSNKALRISGY